MHLLVGFPNAISHREFYPTTTKFLTSANPCRKKVCEAIYKPNGRRDDHPDQHQSQHDERMGRRELVHVLEKERVQLRYLPEYHELAEGHESHVSTGRIEPPHGRPATRRELQHGPLELARRALDVPDAHPLVLPHLQYRADLQSHPDAQTVAHEDVEYHGVPPALGKVRQQVGERDLRHFPHDTDGPEDAQVPYEDGLEGPAEKVGDREHVQVVPDLLDTDVRAIDPVLLVHVDVERGKARVDPDEDLAHGLVLLEEDEQEEHLVEAAAAEDDAPDGRVGSGERPVGKGQDRDDEEEEDDAEEPGAQVVLDVRAVPGGVFFFFFERKSFVSQGFWYRLTKMNSKTE